MIFTVNRCSSQDFWQRCQQYNQKFFVMHATQHGLYSHSLDKVHVMKERHVEACLIFATEDLDKSVKLREKTDLSDETRQIKIIRRTN